MKSYPIKHPLDNGSEGWALRNIKEMFPSFHDELEINDNIIYSKKIDTFKDQRILIIGGGPTTKFLYLDQLGYYDSIWSMNNFFLNPSLKRVKLDLIVCGANTNLVHDELREYLSRFTPYMGFEPHPKYGKENTQGHKEFEDWKGIKEIINAPWYNKTYVKFAYQTKFWGRIGLGARMLILAGHLKAKQVDFIGIDGATGFFNNKHDFEKDKTQLNLPSSLKNLPIGVVLEEFRVEYEVLKKKLMRFDTKYLNLATKYPYNDIGTMLDQ